MKLLKNKTKSDCYIDTGNLAIFLINKIKTIYEYIEFNTDNPRRSNYINKLCEPSIVSNPIPNITPEYIEKLIKLTHFKTCIYIDNIIPYQLKRNLNVLCMSYTDLIINCIQYANFVQTLKHSIITKILENPSLDKSLPKNYRPISNLSLLSKLIENIIANNLTQHIMTNKLHNPIQSARKQNHKLRLN